MILPAEPVSPAGAGAAERSPVILDSPAGGSDRVHAVRPASAPRDAWFWAIAGIVHGVALLLVLRNTIDWDGIAFLMKPRAAWFADRAHLLYPPLLWAAGRALHPFGISADEAGRILSAICGAGAFMLLGPLFSREGANRIVAAGAAALVTTTPAFVRQATGVEVYAPALLFLAGAGYAAARSREGPRAAWLAASWASWAAASMLHVAAAGSVFWVAALAARRGRGRFPHGGVLLLFAAATAGFAALAGAGVGDVAVLARDVRGFLPWARFGIRPVLDGIGPHAGKLFQFLVEDAPVLSLLGFAAIAACAVGRRTPWAALWLVAPYLALYCITGVPLHGLVLPACAGFGHAIAHFAGTSARRFQPAFGVVVAVALAAQLALSTPRALREAKSHDPLREQALAVAERVPAGAVVVAGPIAQHLRYYGGVDVVAVDEVFHRSRATSGREADPVAVLREALRPWLARGRVAYITNEGARRLFESAVPAYRSQDEAVRDLVARLRSSEKPIVVREGALWLERLRIR